MRVQSRSRGSSSPWLWEQGRRDDLDSHDSMRPISQCHEWHQLRPQKSPALCRNVSIADTNDQRPGRASDVRGVSHKNPRITAPSGSC